MGLLDGVLGGSTQPLACRLPAEPGWRAVAVTWGDDAGDGMRAVNLSVVEIAAWGIYGAGTAHDPKPSKYSRLGQRTMNVGASLFGMGGGVDLVPLDGDGKRIDAMRIVEPGGPDADALVAEAKEWIAAFNAAVKAAEVAATPPPR